MQTTTNAPVQVTNEEKELDRRFIEAFMHPEQHLLSALYRDGMSVEEVNVRAARMGLTSEFIKRCRLTRTLPGMRMCIRCDVRFLSAGPHNRLCKRCPPR